MVLTKHSTGQNLQVSEVRLSLYIALAEDIPAYGMACSDGSWVFTDLEYERERVIMSSGIYCFGFHLNKRLECGDTFP